MEILSAKNLNFTYPKSSKQNLAIDHFTVNEGDFMLICGPSGSGKSTLTRLLKHELKLHGDLTGEILYKGIPLEKHPPLLLAAEIGLVFQNPENQIVMNTVMEELLFGMENIGFSSETMRKKLAEVVHYFDLNDLLNQETSTLSGGEKQRINLASILLLDPKVLILDEPTAQLDPIAARDFLMLLKQLNDDFGMTILIVEHRLDELFSLVNRVVLIEEGEIVFDQTPRAALKQMYPKMHAYLPQATQLYFAFKDDLLDKEKIPYNVKEARTWLSAQTVTRVNEQKEGTKASQKPLLELSEIDFSYQKHTKPILNNLSFTVREGEWLALLGANGTGKSTLLKIIAGLLKAQHGKMKVSGKRVKKIDSKQIGYLPQNPELYFLHETLREEYQALQEKHGRSAEDVEKIIQQFQLADLLNHHPYDLSGGELQRAALAGILISQPKLLLLDEPTKGLDPAFKDDFASVITTIQQQGVTIIMITHDLEFTAKHANRCAMMFQGDVVVTEGTKTFFSENNYYTTMVQRMTRDRNVPPVITVEEAKATWQLKRKSPLLE